jgi:hypothetical protein
MKTWSNPWYVTEEQATSVAVFFLTEFPKAKKDRFHKYLVDAFGAFTYEDADFLWHKIWKKAKK